MSTWWLILTLTDLLLLTLSVPVWTRTRHTAPARDFRARKGSPLAPPPLLPALFESFPFREVSGQPNLLSAVPGTFAPPCGIFAFAGVVCFGLLFGSQTSLLLT